MFPNGDMPRRSFATRRAPAGTRPARDSAEELDRRYGALAKNGQELMPLGDYGFSRRFGWVNDRFGVSRQLNLPN